MKKIYLSLLFALFCFAVPAQTTANLRMNLEKNKVYRFRFLTEQTINQTINGNQQTIESKTDYTLSLKMIDATADFLIAELRFDTLKSVTNSMGKVMTITSKNEGDIKSKEMAEVLSCTMNRLSKNAIYAKLDFTGKPIEVVNSKMLSDIITRDTNLVSGQMAGAIKKQIVSMVSDNALKTMIEPFTWYLPGREVKAGDNWDITATTTSGGMALDIVTNFHLDKMSENTADITSESKIKTAANAAPMVQGGAKITYDDLQGLSKSTLSIDPRTGLIIEDNSKTHISGNLGVSMPGMSMQIPMDISSVSKIVALP